jgi:hypothetical protein
MSTNIFSLLSQNKLSQICVKTIFLDVVHGCNLHGFDDLLWEACIDFVVYDVVCLDFTKL